MSRFSSVWSVVIAINVYLLPPFFAQADVARAVIQPPVAIKITRAQTPLELDDVLKKKISGLDFESAAVTAKALKQASDYILYRRGGWTKAQINTWSTACENGMSTQTANPFCRIEQERALTTSGASLATKIRTEKRALADSLREGDFSKADAKSYGEVVAALGSAGDLETVIMPLVRKVGARKTCVPGALATAMGAKTEEMFPDKDAVELATTLYRKGLACGKDFSQATAAYRLGLILIWQKQYREVDNLMRKVEAVPEASMLHARATFWRYQAAIALGDEKLKKEAKDELLSRHPLTFQNLAANGDDELMMSRMVNVEPLSVFTRSLVRPDLNAVLRAAEALEKAGSTQLAAEILDRNVNDIATIEPEVRLYTAAFLHRIGYSLPKFKILSSLFQDSPKLVTIRSMELMFPLSYVDVVRKKQAEMDPLLFLSLMRQESAFNPEAMSGVGARGLMQLMPATARGIRRVSKAQLFQPEINIEVGTKYFLGRLAQYGGDVELTLAAYNAGFARVDQWRRRYPTENKLLFLDFIPFRETRDYVSAILRNYYWYVRLYAPDTSSVALKNGQIQTPKAAPGFDRMQSILAANAGDAARLTRTPAAVAPVGN